MYESTFELVGRFATALSRSEEPARLVESIVQQLTAQVARLGRIAQKMEAHSSNNTLEFLHGVHVSSRPPKQGSSTGALFSRDSRAANCQSIQNPSLRESGSPKHPARSTSETSGDGSATVTDLNNRLRVPGEASATDLWCGEKQSATDEGAG
nr:hypothetical protein GCM10017611_13600 [Rhodococcus wratislaviensis]